MKLPVPSWIMLVLSYKCDLTSAVAEKPAEKEISFSVNSGYILLPFEHDNSVVDNSMMANILEKFSIVLAIEVFLE